MASKVLNVPAILCEQHLGGPYELVLWAFDALELQAYSHAQWGLHLL